MKTKLLIPAVLAIVLPQLALPAMAARPAKNENLLGVSAPPSSTPDRKIKIGPDTKKVNVQAGEIVRFDVGDKTFSWKFDDFGKVSVFDLNEIAPPGVLDHSVKVYVAKNPRTPGL